MCVGRTEPTPSWLPTHPLPFSTCAECQTHSVEGAGRTESTPMMSSSPPGPHTGSYSLSRVHRARRQQEEWQAKQGRACTGPGLASSYWEPRGEPAVLSSQGTSDVCSPLLSVGVPKYERAGRLWSEKSACLIYRRQLVQTDGTVLLGAVCLLRLRGTWFILGARMWAFRGVIFIVRWSGWEDVPVKAQILKKRHGDRKLKVSLFRGHGWLLFPVGCNE